RARDYPRPMGRQAGKIAGLRSCLPACPVCPLDTLTLMRIAVESAASHSNRLKCGGGIYRPSWPHRSICLPNKYVGIGGTRHAPYAIDAQPPVVGKHERNLIPLANSSDKPPALMVVWSWGCL